MSLEEARARRAALFATARAELGVLVESFAGAVPVAFRVLLAKYEQFAAAAPCEDAASVAERRLHASMRTVLMTFDAADGDDDDDDSCSLCTLVPLRQLAPDQVVRLAATADGRHHGACALVRAGCCLPCAPLLFIGASGATLRCPLCRACVRTDEVLRGSRRAAAEAHGDSDGGGRRAAAARCDSADEALRGSADEALRDSVGRRRRLSRA